MIDLAQLNTRTVRWQATREALVRQTDQERAKVEKTKTELQDIKSAIALLQYVSAETSKAGEEQTAALATLALRETFDDQELTLVVEQKAYRGHPGVTFKLKDELKGVEGDVMKSFGGGPASLIGVVLQAISVVRQPGMARFLILDEPMIQVSESYQEAAGKLLRKLCDPPPRGLGFEMLVITHEENIAAAAHKRYRAYKSADGKGLVLQEERDQGALNEHPSQVQESSSAVQERRTPEGSRPSL